MVGYDRSSLCWVLWLILETKFVKSSHLMIKSEAKILDIVGELKAVKLSDDEDEPWEEEEEAQINGDSDLGGQPPQDPKPSNYSSPGNRLHRSSRLAQRHRLNTQQNLRISDDNNIRQW